MLHDVCNAVSSIYSRVHPLFSDAAASERSVKNGGGDVAGEKYVENVVVVCPPTRLG